MPSNFPTCFPFDSDPYISMRRSGHPWPLAAYTPSLEIKKAPEGAFQLRQCIYAVIIIYRSLGRQ